MTQYTVVTFAPVQGFIEKTRKLRDLYGASLILSHLSYRLVQEANKTAEVISPAIPSLQKGMPNRILIKGDFSRDQVHNTLLSAWKELLYECRTWIERKLPGKYHWEREWQNLGNHAWEIFRGEGESIKAAMDDLERCKLSRGWTGLNWIGESSSLTGADAIAFPGLGAEDRNPNNRVWRREKEDIEKFYQSLARALGHPSAKESTLFAENEKISIGELVKRLVAIDSTSIAKKLDIPRLGESFSDIYRRPDEITDTEKGRWTGWFMGDGDEVGKYLQKLASKGDEEVKGFSNAMREWGENFVTNFPDDFGRVVYAGGDDFLGVIYSEKSKPQIAAKDALSWLINFSDKWKQHGVPITVSVGFVWAGHSVPQRDILMHCREAEQKAKSLGRNRVTIRVVFNSGQFIEWTCPWHYLNVLIKYQDRDGNSNWNHIYSDLAQLEARGAFNTNVNNFDKNLALSFFDIYFPGKGIELQNNDFARDIIGYQDEDKACERVTKLVDWIQDLIKVGFQMNE
ncbi:hypothetical protein RIVM261_011400 [Rivularia sp. IAM M-261]|nr:hypothetical protein RIVM261_011400 [Rivularia sp. IAM M-261]